MQTTSIDSGSLTRRLAGRLADRRRTATARREHARVMRDPRMASEHAAAATRADAMGEPGCVFCR